MTTGRVPDAGALDALLRRGHDELRRRRYTQAIRSYEEARAAFPEIAPIVEFSIDLARRRRTRESSARPVAPGVHRRYLAAAAAAGLIDAGDFARPDPEAAFPAASSPEDGPLVSIIMPVADERAAVGEAVRSVLDQTWSQWELLICDVTADEEVAARVHLSPDHRITHHRLEGSSAAVATNHGITRAAGAILAFLDPDHVWHPHHLEETVRAHRDGPHPVVRTAGWEATLDEEAVVVDAAMPRIIGGPTSSDGHEDPSDLSAVSIHRAVLDEVGVVDPRRDGEQDRELLERCARRFPPATLDAPLVLRRRAAADEAADDADRRQEEPGVGVALRPEPALDADPAPGCDPSPRPAVAWLDDWRPVRDPARTVAIKIAAPSAESAWEWGDFHFAHHLADALDRLGWRCAVHCRDQWYTHDADINVVLRGRARFDPSRSGARLNILWSISHPDRLEGREELDIYDHVFVASSPFAEELDARTAAPVSVLHQATDPAVFADPDEAAVLPEPVVFIGNSRGVHRRLVSWAVEAGVDVAVWGTRWERFLPEGMVHGDHVPNDELAAHYAGAAIVLNDHWETMAEYGYLSNRIFDASAAGAFVVSDPVSGLQETFGEDIAVVDSPASLRRTVDWHLRHPRERRERAARARERVLAHHTFDHRAWDLSLVMRRLGNQPVARPRTRRTARAAR